MGELVNNNTSISLLSHLHPNFQDPRTTAKEDDELETVTNITLIFIHYNTCLIKHILDEKKSVNGHNAVGMVGVLEVLIE